ncbi:unnamed protein product [Protopolystoma xenopodis]|uniref:Uncharacterized protein n=1 Tax=Protopolystoma xenopodis TaxID=117903 RepID=A0A448XC72_9PLAT|nr:unnamed protein product [Protopolystoma xenopodis]
MKDLTTCAGSSNHFLSVNWQRSVFLEPQLNIPSVSRDGRIVLDRVVPPTRQPSGLSFCFTQIDSLSSLSIFFPLPLLLLFGQLCELNLYSQDHLPPPGWAPWLTRHRQARDNAIYDMKADWRRLGLSVSPEAGRPTSGLSAGLGNCEIGPATDGLADLASSVTTVPSLDPGSGPGALTHRLSEKEVALPGVQLLTDRAVSDPSFSDA